MAEMCFKVESICLLFLVFHCALCRDLFDGTFKTLSFSAHNGTAPISALKYSSFDRIDMSESFDHSIFMTTINRLYILRDDIIYDKLSQNGKLELEHLITVLKDLAMNEVVIDADIEVNKFNGAGDIHLSACTLLAMIFDATSSQEKEVLRLTRVAAAAGHSDAQSNYASLIEQGRISMKNEKTALKEIGKWRTRSSKQGNPEAQYMLGLTLLGGRGIKANEAKAKYWLQQAVFQGHPCAQVSTETTHTHTTFST